MTALAGRAGLAGLAAVSGLVLAGCGSGHPTSAPTTTGATTTTASTATTSTGLTPATSTASTMPSSTVPNATSSSVGATTIPAQATTGCRNLVVSTAVKAAVTSAFGQVATGTSVKLVHIAPAPGVFFNGECDSTFYAATRFVSTAGATLDEQVALQDDGAMMKYFSAPSAGSWSFVASQGFPGIQGCGAIAQIPSALAALWLGCPSGF